MKINIPRVIKNSLDDEFFHIFASGLSAEMTIECIAKSINEEFISSWSRRWRVIVNSNVEMINLFRSKALF